MQFSNIGDALFTGTQQRVLALLYGAPDKSFYTNEIVRWVGMGRGTVTRELGRLQGSGLLSVSSIGNQHHYQANVSSPIYRELLGIVRKTFGLAGVLSEAVGTLDSHIIYAFVYGSMAKANDVQTSDIDLMLITNDNLAYAEVIEVFLPLEASLQRQINPTIYVLSDYLEKLEQNKSFLSRVMEQPKIWIKGSDNEINTLGKSSKNQRAKN